MARALITLYGRSTWGLFNSVWAAIKEHDYVPDNVHILTAGCDLASAQVAGRMVSVLLREYGTRGEVKEWVVDGEDLGAVSALVLKLASDERSTGNQVALDVTPGKKMFVLGSVLAWSADTYRWIKLDPDVYYIDNLPVAMDAAQFGFVALAATALSYFATLYPATKAARLRPVDGLRSE